MDTALIIIDIQNDYFDGGAMTLVKNRNYSTQKRI